MEPDERPRSDARWKVFGIVATLILLIVLIIFVGYNIYYVTQNG